MSECHARVPRPEMSPVRLRIDLLIEPDGDGFHAYSPALPGLHVDGDTIEETIENSRDVVISYLLSMLKHGEPIPVGPDFTSLNPPTVPRGAKPETLLFPWPITSQMSGASSRT